MTRVITIEAYYSAFCFLLCNTIAKLATGVNVAFTLWIKCTLLHLLVWYLICCCYCLFPISHEQQMKILLLMATSFRNNILMVFNSQGHKWSLRKVQTVLESANRNRDLHQHPLNFPKQWLLKMFSCAHYFPKRETLPAPASPYLAPFFNISSLMRNYVASPK